jgi:hypothetical protein
MQINGLYEIFAIRFNGEIVMILLKDFLESETLGVAYAQIRSNTTLKKFEEYLPENVNKEWALILSKFAQDAPWTYWDSDTVDTALAVLESSPERTIDAMNFWSKSIGIAVENIFRISSALSYEENLDASKSRDLLRLATEFHPEYLRHNEHIYGNLLTCYWGILKRGSVQGKFDIRGAVNYIKSKNLDSLLLGYDDRVRNAIAHGQITFTGLGGIRYGEEIANYELYSSSFLRIFDDLWRTCNSLVIAILLFIARNEDLTSGKLRLAPSLIALIASSILERKTLSITGAIESVSILDQKQLHIFVKTSLLKREWVILDCMRISALLLKHGADAYGRFLFDIDQGRRISSLVIIKADVLKNLLIDPLTPQNRIGEALDEAPLLLFNEGKWTHRIKAWREIFSSHFELAWKNIENDWEQRGLRISDQSYRILKIKNQSNESVRRIHVYAVLNNQTFVNNPDILKRIVRRIIKRTAKTTVPKETTFSNRHSPGLPTYVWVSLYKIDGTFRWVTSEGWLGNNLIVIGERIFSRFKLPIFVPVAEEIWKKIRLRYSLDLPNYLEALGNVEKTLSDIGIGKDNE